ncbi:helix-turn-helix domain-containing protein [bacterium]|nr:helix-turn-helix domain-containing protein [bacterium]
MAATKLKIAILERNITQRELARKAGIHESIISLIATGRYIPDGRQKELISNVVEVEPENLFEPYQLDNKMD